MKSTFFSPVTYRAAKQLPPQHSALRGLQRRSTWAAHSDIESLSGNDADLEVKKVKFDYVTPDAVVVGSQDNVATFVDAFSLKRLPAGTPRTHFTKLVSDIAFSSTFFRRYWLLLDASLKDAEDIGASIADLDLKNVGIALYERGKQDDLSLLHMPSGGPVPDRQQKSLQKLAS